MLRAKGLANHRHLWSILRIKNLEELFMDTGKRERVSLSWVGRECGIE
jgi:hypothetical protein